MSLGDGRMDSSRLQDVARSHSRHLVAFDMERLARESGTSPSAVMFGAISASGLLPIVREQFETTIRQFGRGADASLRGFALAWDAMRDCSMEAAAAETAATAPIAHHSEISRSPAHPIDAAFPAPVRDFGRLGYDRLSAFQDGAYAGLYVDRLQRILTAEKSADRTGMHGFALTREMARFLALWMAFDDVVRVADLKIRASRFARVRREVGADDGDIVRIVDHFKPGIPEFAALLPERMGKRLASWDRRRQHAGKPPFAMALHLRTDTVTGFLALRALAGLRWLRRRGGRYRLEQEAIERWLGAIESAAKSDWQCAFEVALCGRLIKGYGATNERGKRNLEHIIDHLVPAGAFATDTERAAAIRLAREAALADEGGNELDRLLVQVGAPPRPVVAQPILWSKKRPVTHAAKPG
jgi:indolepyruvate ferredoxin oxidoreductase beta subunit